MFIEAQDCFEGGAELTDETVLDGEGEEIGVDADALLLNTHHVPQGLYDLDLAVVLPLVDARALHQHGPKCPREYLLPEAKARGSRLAGFSLGLL